jgi:hypothetical protein
VRLPEWIVQWLKDAGQSQAALIERALCRFYKLSPPKDED